MKYKAPLKKPRSASENEDDEEINNDSSSSESNSPDAYALRGVYKRYKSINSRPMIFKVEKKPNSSGSKMLNDITYQSHKPGTDKYQNSKQVPRLDDQRLKVNVAIYSEESFS